MGYLKLKTMNNKTKLDSMQMRHRIKKYDVYTHRPGKTVRGSLQAQDIVPIIDSTHTKKTVDITHSEIIKSTVTKKHNNQTNELKSKVRPTAPSKNKDSLAESVTLQAVSQAQATPQDSFNDLYDTWMFGTIKKKLSRIQKAFYVFGVFVISFSLFVSIQTFITNNQARQQVAGVATADDYGVPQGTGNDPSEAGVPDSALRDYMPANPEDPRYLRVPELNIFARVTNLGLTNSGAVDAPWNINDVGWYNKSARPGNSSGASLLLGHVSGWTAPGVFKHLDRLKEGSQFEVEKGTGEIIRYEVVRTQNFALADVDMARILSAEVRGEHDLKLMTCSGRYNRDTETYEERYVVYARQIK